MHCFAGGVNMARNGQYPNLYRRIHDPNLEEPFINRNILKQSAVQDAKEGIRISVVNTKYTEKFRKVITLHDLFEAGLEKSRFDPCLGHRSSTDQAYTYVTYEEVDEKIRAFGSALRDIVGHQSALDNFVGIYGRNSVPWVVAQQACASYGYTFVPLYDTLGQDAMQYILSQTEMKAILCHTSKEANHALKDFRSSLRYVVLVEDSDEARKLKEAYANDVKVFTFEEFLKHGRTKEIPKTPPKPDDLCELCYTSGSTGTPKGVMIAHEQFVDAVKAIVNTEEEKLMCKATVHVSYLPLAHIFEQLLLAVALLFGARSAFLTRGVDTLLSDVHAIRPTVLASVPRVLARIRSEYYKRLPKSSFMHKLLQFCIDKKIAEQADGKFNHSSLMDTILFKKFRKMLGNRICGILCGGAPLSPEISEFFRAAFNCPIIEGYGSTETTGVLCMTLIGETLPRVAGAITCGLEVKLVDVPDMGLVASRDGVGEICVRGLRCTKGYYRNEEGTKSLRDEEGWMRVGDVAQWMPNGSIKIVDRCKNMFKLSQGEYVAAEKVESIYLNCNLVKHVLVDGDPARTFAVAVVVPDLEDLRRELKINSRKEDKRVGAVPSNNSHSSFTGLNDEELCQQVEVRRFVLNAMNAQASEKNLKGFEMAKSVYLTRENICVENGLMTPTLKVARYKARAHFKSAIQQLYEEGELNSLPST
ncbi:unnamed protein product [Calicophoron daubneyi]|uniref:long-chain-fatty-acid--CoA ligase n=1 Tax=Calicophoron daubneyi TaxID=300641 RepID=A0AAV2TNB6_CALDB